uniref:Uncharacterized protein n=1 Tax=Kalanchoe fedtschenkoi TaxID=63787 RepID=A0A7N1A7Q4_KALFE
MLSKNGTHNIAAKKTMLGLMKVPSNMNEKPSVNNKVYLMKKLSNLNMKKGPSVVKHLNYLNTIFNQLVTVEIKFGNEMCTLILLASLPNS